MRHTPPGTAVEITVDATGRVSVRDYGPGISTSERETVFLRFWQGGRDRKSGAGLGLDIVRRVVEAHGGSVYVDDTPGLGATFVMKIPASRSGTGARLSTASQPQPKPPPRTEAVRTHQHV